MIYILAALALAVSCGKPEEKAENTAALASLVTEVSVPSTSIFLGSTEELTIPGKGFDWYDEIFLEHGGVRRKAVVTDVDGYSLTFFLPRGLDNGTWRLILRRERVEQVLGYLEIRNSVSLDVPDKAGATLKGAVFCGQKPLQGVVVSDGVELTMTDADGFWWLSSAKKNGLVFVSLPSGYTVGSDENGLPAFWQALKTKGTEVEQVNFELVESDIPDGGDFCLLAFASVGKPVFAVNLGDMSFDLYWYDHNYSLKEYVATWKEAELPFQTFHIPGNHDNDERATGATLDEIDFNAAAPYRALLGPTYYSFNAGGIHFVMLDDIMYVNNGATATSGGDHAYTCGLTTEQFNWMRKDIQTVSDKTRPIVVCMHAPMNSVNSSFSTTQAIQDYAAFRNCFNGFSEVHILSGHVHNNRNVEVGQILEHNIAAVCATWWWTGYYGYPHICTDGVPGGYEAFFFNGNRLTEWNYRGIDHDNDIKFRVYDLNRVKAWYASDEKAAIMQARDASRAADYRAFTDNPVLVNVYNWDPAWKVEMTENGKELAVSRTWCRDPYHTMCYDVQRYAQNNGYTASSSSSYNNHMFSATASSATSTVVVRVTDRFGHVYTETVSRPRDFTQAAYAKEWK